MEQVTVYNKEGKEAGTFTPAPEVFAAPWRPALVHQVVRAMEANARIPWAHTKDRSEVAGTNQKPWRQKGTGRARHGQTISPIWRGGGIAHGPRNSRVYTQKINKRMRRQAMCAVLARKFKDGEVLFVEGLSFAAPKAAEAKRTLAALAGAREEYAALATKRKNAALIVLPALDRTVALSFRNIPSVFVEEARNLNPVALLRYRYVIIVNPEKAVRQLQERATASRARRAAAPAGQ